MDDLELEKLDRVEQMTGGIFAAPKHIAERLNKQQACKTSGVSPYEGKSNCTSSFSRYEISRSRLKSGTCPVKDCRVDVQNHQVLFQKRKGTRTRVYRPFCPEHGIRIHTNGFVYYNGPSLQDKILATRRNLNLNAQYFLDNFLGRKNSENKVDSRRLCFESSEDAVTYNVFSELLRCGQLGKLVNHLVHQDTSSNIELYLWGCRIEFEKKVVPYLPLQEVRQELEKGIGIQTEPDIMLVVPGKLLICIEAKFGSDHTTANGKDVPVDQKPKKPDALMRKYCEQNRLIDTCQIFDASKSTSLPVFYDQLFRNLVFAASMAKLAGIPNWRVFGLRSRHRQYTKGNRPVLRALRSLLKPPYKKHILELEWEEIYEQVIAGEPDLHDLAWYMKSKSIHCARAFNCF